MLYSRLSREDNFRTDAQHVPAFTSKLLDAYGLPNYGTIIDCSDLTELKSLSSIELMQIYILETQLQVTYQHKSATAWHVTSLHDACYFFA